MRTRRVRARLPPSPGDPRRHAPPARVGAPRPRSGAAAGTLHGLQLGAAAGQRGGRLGAAVGLERGDLAAHGVDVAGRAPEGLVEGREGLAGLVQLQVDGADRDVRQRPLAGQLTGLLVVGDRLSGAPLDDCDVTAAQGFTVGVRGWVGHVGPA